MSFVLGLAPPVRADAPSVVVLAPPDIPALENSASPTPTPAPDLTAYEGKPVRAAEVVFDDDPWGNIKPPTLRTVHIGEPFTADIARAALLEAAATGAVGAAHVNVITEGDGVRIRVHAVPRRLIEGLRLELHHAPLEREDVLREAKLEEGGELMGDGLTSRKRVIEVLLARHGFPDAQVDISTRETDAPTRVLLVIDVQPGAPRTIQKRGFYTFGASDEDVQRYTKDYDTGTGDRADEVVLQQTDFALETRLRAAGWYEAVVSHDIVRASGSIVLRVRLDTGSRYLPRFEGADHYDADALTTALDLEADPDYGQQHLADKLRRFYVTRGYLDATIGFELRGKVGDPTRYLLFHVKEGHRVHVASRTYACVTQTDIQGLSGGGPSSASSLSTEIDSYLDEDLPGADFLANPDPHGVDALFGGGAGVRALPIDLDPNTTFSPDTYEKALAHVQELYRNEGFLTALVGPAQILRRRCDPKSRAGRCDPIPFQAPVPDPCTYDRGGLPLAVSSLDQAFACSADPVHNIECESRIALRIPVKLGPRTALHDMVFAGNKSLSDKELGEAADLSLGGPVNALKLEDARKHIVDRYREEGFFYADVRSDVQRSLDNTRARVRFDVTEGERVIVRQIIIQGNQVTNESVIRNRVAIKIGQPYRASDVRKTQDRVATLNVFTSVSIVLQNPQVPQKDKTVIITVQEKKRQYLEFGPGFSTGEGVRGSIEYRYYNIFGSAVSLTARGSISYLPDVFISDPSIAATFAKLSLGERIAARATLSVGVPDIGLGPDVRANFDGVFAQDVERYFTILKGAFIPTAYWRPLKQVNFAFSASAEYNDLFVFNNQTPAEASTLSNNNLDLARLLRAPAGQSAVFSQRVLWTWDRRDNSFNAHTGTYVVLGVEHVNSIPVSPQYIENTIQCATCAVIPSGSLPVPSQAIVTNNPGHFLKLSQTFSGYFPLPFYKKITFAATLRLGEILQFDAKSTTYPDRFFFMGGIDSIRSFQQDSMLPQDAVDHINQSNGAIQPSQIAIRGGNLMINPRVELRIPITGPFETVIFFDSGNLWQQAGYPFDFGFTWRAAVGTGIRVQTPVGPILLDYGINLTRQQAYEDFGALNFAIGVF